MPFILRNITRLMQLMGSTFDQKKSIMTALFLTFFLTLILLYDEISVIPTLENEFFIKW